MVYWRQALGLREKLGEKGGVVLSQQNLGFLATSQGRFAEAMKAFLAALEGSRQIDFKLAAAVSYGNIGQLHAYEGRYAAALEAFGEALGLLEELNDPRGLAEFTLKLADTRLELGQTDLAGDLLERAASWIESTGHREQRSDHQRLRGAWHLARGEHAAARRSFETALVEAEASHSRLAIWRARLAREAHAANPGSATRELAAVFEEADRLGASIVRIEAAEALARAHRAGGRLELAERAARTALSGATACGLESRMVRLHALLGDILETRGQPEAAARAHADSTRHLEVLRARLAPPERDAFDALPWVREVQASDGRRPGRRPRPDGEAT